MDRTKIAQDTVQFELRYYQEDNVVFYEGEYGDCLYDIQQGSVYVFKNYQVGSGKRLLAQLGPGDYFGELAILEAMPRNATIVSAMDGTILRLIHAEDFGAYAAQNPDKALKIMQSMGNQFHNLNEKYIQACGVVAEMMENRRTKAKESEELKTARAKMIADFEEHEKKKGL